MYSSAQDRLDQLIQNQQQHALCGGLKGLEKESLRVSQSGKIAQTDHPRALGSALTHPYITTDYSEALLEFITPPFKDTRDTLSFMQDLHAYTCQHLDQEILWATSMPCVVDGERSIPIARYGSSNIGQMKHVYRHGLWHRYGRSMQAISGIHFNYSLPESLWPILHQQSGSSAALNDYISEQYFALIRNLQRMGWLVLYLFGASPALCKSFLCGKQAKFSEFDDCTYFEPEATSLRMSDIGYKNTTQAGIGVCYNSLKEYTDCLIRAIETPYPPYQKIGIRGPEGYRQLNANILQIENEYYSTARPKQIIRSGEKPSRALKSRGVKYIELRSVDVGAFHPMGIDETQLRFLEAFLIFCVLCDSPEIDVPERELINRNLTCVATHGRASDLMLARPDGKLSLSQWATKIVDAMEAICMILDENEIGRPYHQALMAQRVKINDPDLTPSAQILAQMREQQMSFFNFALRLSQQHQKHFEQTAISPAQQSMLDEAARASLQEQTQLETNQSETFEEFLSRYFAE